MHEGLLSEGFEDDKSKHHVHIRPPGSVKRSMGNLVSVIGGMCTTLHRVVALLPVRRLDVLEVCVCWIW